MERDLYILGFSNDIAHDMIEVLGGRLNHFEDLDFVEVIGVFVL